MPQSMNPVVSVIVPVYNAEKWLRTCVESICAQSYPYLEIILIDDGSQDRSLEICHEMEAQDSRIYVINKANSGVSDTRNYGIRMATGSFITFVDADDYLREDILEKAVDRMAGGQADLCVWNVCRVMGETSREEPHIQEGAVPCTSAVTTIVYDSCSDVPLGRYFRASWGKLFNTAILKNNGILFPVQQKIGEDALFLLEYIRCIKHIVGIDCAGYFYRILDSSAVRRYRTDLLQQNQMQLDAILAFLKRYPEYDSIQMQTALTCLSWDMFRRLIRNDLIGKKIDNITEFGTSSDAESWFEENCGVLRQGSIMLNLMPKRTRFQYILAHFMPTHILIKLSEKLEEKKL